MIDSSDAAKEIRIVLADDQAIIRQGLKYIIDAQADMETVGEAGNGEEAVSLAARVKPNLMLMDIQMPVYDGIEATRLILKHDPHIKVILLTTFDVQSYVADGIRAGAVGYLLKDADTRQLLDGIRAAHRGAAVYRSTTAGKALAEAMKPEAPSAEASVPGGEPLTDKELEVLQMMAYGRRNYEIATALHISEGTVKTHVHRILGKLQVEDRTQAVVIALRRQMVK